MLVRCGSRVPSHAPKRRKLLHCDRAIRCAAYASDDAALTIATMSALIASGRSGQPASGGRSLLGFGVRVFLARIRVTRPIWRTHPHATLQGDNVVRALVLALAEQFPLGCRQSTAPQRFLCRDQFAWHLALKLGKADPDDRTVRQPDRFAPAGPPRPAPFRYFLRHQ